jgi:hypothetical protein
MLLLHSSNNWPGWSPADFQAVIQRYRKWREGITARGVMTGGNKLRDDSGRVMKKNGNGKVVVTDGPYTELREVIGGFFMIEVASYDQAVEIAGDCPHLDYGTIEIREIEPTGPSAN